MEPVALKLNENQRGAFLIIEGDRQLGEMVIGISGKKLKVYHTEVAPEAEGKGLAKQMLDSMVSYAREQQLQVVPLCAFVLAQFNRHPDQYADLWKKDGQG
ncbi:MAG TPA: GNAT family N-acetyltransferase [Flavisolibacter sp.]|jgi:hypothetical protein|nr:GNAT family N-acetyltransferase [Flavisolibacter sp.]